MKQINSGSVASTQQKDAAPEDHTAPPQQPQQSTDVNPSAEKGKDMAQLTGNYPPTPVLNELIMRALEVTLQDQDITTTTAPAQLTMLSTNLHLIKVISQKYLFFDYTKFKNICEVQGFSNPYAARTESIQFWCVTNWAEGQKLIETLPYKLNISAKLWKTIAFGSYMNLQDFTYKSLLSSIRD
ncbi:hypothetical protein C2G38_2036468 [Gigaspora rosea]|uniref:Uncharacterized protein n=1 Tax=Gigaspora rosea TaxID=44941 RepID=A0A397V8V2_9GLOM|nr:hypothetical protein C2G38_2036468 [Gigaspora rosea]